MKTVTTIEEAVAVLNEKKWRGRTDWFHVNYVDDPQDYAQATLSSSLSDRLFSEDAIAIANSLLSGWRPIETAPKDGTLIDVWQQEHWSQFKKHDGTPSEMGEMIEARRLENICWLENGWDFWGENRAGWSAGFKNFVITDDRFITHWMPIPDPPREDKNEQ